MNVIGNYEDGLAKKEKNELHSFHQGLGEWNKQRGRMAVGGEPLKQVHLDNGYHDSLLLIIGIRNAHILDLYTNLVCLPHSFNKLCERGKPNQKLIRYGDEVGWRVAV